MTQTFAINENNDLFLGPDGNLAIVNGVVGVEQACQTASQAQLGEMVLATTSGIPNFQSVWNGSPNLAIFEAFLRNTLLAVPGVLVVVTLSTNVSDHVLKYTAQISSQFGLLEVNGAIPAG